MSPYRENARVWEAPQKPPWWQVALLTAGTVAASLFAQASCMSYVLGPTDTAALRDSVELAARAYLASDGGRARAYDRAIYCSDLGVLGRSGVFLDAGPAPIQCEVAR